MKKEFKLLNIIIISILLSSVIFSNLIFNSLSLDDSFITYRYSKKLAEGNGIIWNIGEKPVEGYTNFSWMILNALVIKLGVNPLLFSKFFSFLIHLIVVLIFFFFASKIFNSILLRFFTAFIIAVTPILGFYAQSGMETLLFTFLTTLALLSYINWIYYKKYHYLFFASLFCSFAALTRPEGLGVFIIILLYQSYETIKNKSNIKMVFNYLLIPFMVIFIPYFIWRLSYFGYILPNTYYAKHTGSTIGEYFGGLLYLSSAIMHYFAVSITVIVVTLFYLPLNNILEETPLKIKQALSLILFVFISFSLYILFVGGDDISAFPSYRLILPIIPITFWGMSLALSNLFTRTNRFNRVILILIFTFLILINQFADFNRILRYTFPKINNQANSAELIKKFFSIDKNEIIKKDTISNWLENKVNTDDYIAIPWAGRVSYHTNCKIIDMLGLNDIHIAHLPKKQKGIDVKMDADYIISKKPKYIFINVNKAFPLGKITFEQAGGWKLGDKELLEKLNVNKDYQLIDNTPFDITVYKLVH